MFVLGIFPFGAHPALEEVVVGLEGEFGGRSDVVLPIEIISKVAPLACGITGCWVHT